MIPAPLHAPLTYLAGWPRRVAALLCLLMALAMMLTSHRPPATATVPTVVASHPVPAGAQLGAEDLSLAAWPARSVPADAAHASSSVVGRRAATNLSRGMPVISADLLEPAIAAALAEGQAATTVLLANLSQLAILRIGDRVDLYPSMDTGGPTESRPTGSPIAQAAEVLSILPASDTAPDAKPALVVATGRTAAAQLAIQGSGSFLATLVQPP